MTQRFRLAQGGRIDRAKPLSFRFDGKHYEGYEGDTLASALLANGVRLVARSFKYHRPRGILSAGSEEPNALVRLEDGPYATPNLRATEIELYDGLNATSVNAWPSLRWDLGALAGLFSRLLVAGFYYKTFMAPRRFWQRLYEPAIRRMGGMGRAPQEPDPDRYEKRYAHCDVLVIGAGPAGLAAALTAARTGARVILADEQAEPGGALLGCLDEIDGLPAGEWVATALAELATRPEARILPRTTAFGYYDQNYVMLAERLTDHLGPDARPGTARQRLWHVRAKEVVLATGAHERPLVFAGDDRPGVMLAGAVTTYLLRYGVVPGRRAVLFTNNDGAYGAALALAGAGVPVTVLDARDAGGPIAEEVRSQGIETIMGHAVVATRGGRRLRGVEIGALFNDGKYIVGRTRRLKCDLLAMSGGWNPAVHLFSQSQGRLRYDEALSAFVPGVAVQRERTVGAARGSFALADCIAEGLRAGAEAAASAGVGEAAVPRPPALRRVDEAPIGPLWLVPSGDARKSFVDFQNDVTAADIKLAALEGLRSVEHVKRYTTAGMGTDQGKTSNVNALALLSDATSRAIAQTGTTSFRPPYTPVSFGLLAGRDLGDLADPVRVTPIHALHEGAGAVFEDVGQWRRPRFYPRAGEDMAAAVRRECRAVQNAVGIFDASTLGKIELRGPDAGEFLDRIYTNHFRSLKPGRCRYGLMCREDGMVFDDGVTARLGPDHFLMTTTTGNAAKVLDWLEEWLQTEWTHLKVYCTSVTEEWATVTFSGPRARELLKGLAPNLTLEAAGFPLMSGREGHVAGLPARVFRIGYTGELSYEVNVPARSGPALWEAAIAAGATPYGLEAMHVLRAEKGYLAIGQETDGSVTPQDLGMDWILSDHKDFIGRRSLRRSALTAPGRKQLVGLLPVDQDAVLSEGAALSFEAKAPSVAGHVTSSYFGERIGRSFALALVKEGRSRIGDTIDAPLSGIRATITRPVFYDPEGRRRDG